MSLEIVRRPCDEHKLRPVARRGKTAVSGPRLLLSTVPVQYCVESWLENLGLGCLGMSEGRTTAAFSAVAAVVKIQLCGDEV